MVTKNKDMANLKGVSHPYINNAMNSGLQKQHN
jgi:hypothetical protein